MKQTLKSRLLAWLLTICMMVSLVPSVAIPATAATAIEISSFNELLEHVSNPNSYTRILAAGNYKLTDNISLDGFGPLQITGNVTLDLNGYTLSLSGEWSDTIEVDDGGNLTINDSDADNGKLSLNTTRTGSHAALDVEQGGTATINGGTFSVTREGSAGISSAVRVYGTLVINGGVFEGSGNGAVINTANGKITFNGGMFKDAQASSASDVIKNYNTSSGALTTPAASTFNQVGNNTEFYAYTYVAPSIPTVTGGNMTVTMADGTQVTSGSNVPAGAKLELEVTVPNGKILTGWDPAGSYGNQNPITVTFTNGMQFPTPVFSDAGITSEEALKEAIANANEGDIINLDGDITLTAPLTIAKGITINGNGYTLTRNTADKMFKVSSDATLKNITLDGNSQSITASHPMILIDSGANLDMTGCTLKNAKNSYKYEDGITVDIARMGGAVNIMYGSLNAENCDFEDNSTTSSNGGGAAVYLGGGATVGATSATFTNCDFTGNSSNGAGVICANWSKANSDHTDVTINGGKIQNNTCSQGALSSAMDVTLNGAVVIDNNKTAIDGNEMNVVSPRVNITATGLTNGAKVGIYAANGYVIGSGYDEGDEDFFIPDDSSLEVVYDGGSLKLAKVVTGVVSGEQEFKTAISTGISPITLNNDITLTSGVTVDSTVVINGNGNTIKRDASFTGTMFTVSSTGNMTLENVTVDGGAKWSLDGNSVITSGVTPEVINSIQLGGIVARAEDGGVGQLVSVYGGTLNLGAGSILQNNDRRPAAAQIEYARVSDEGSAIYFANYNNPNTGVLTMHKDAIIRNNRVADSEKSTLNGDGAAISMEAGTATISGTITGNYAPRMGAAIRFFDYDCNITFADGATIENNYTNTPVNGAVCFGTNATVSGKVIIRDNYAVTASDTLEANVGLNNNKLVEDDVLELATDSDICVTPGTGAAEGTVIGSDFEDGDEAYFSVDNDTFNAVFDGGSVKLEAIHVAVTENFSLEDYDGTYTTYGYQSNQAEANLDEWKDDTSKDFPKKNSDGTLLVMAEATYRSGAIWTEKLTIGENFSFAAQVELGHSLSAGFGDGFAVLFANDTYLGAQGNGKGFSASSNITNYNATAKASAFGAYVDVYAGKIGTVNAGNQSANSQNYTSSTGVYYVWMDYNNGTLTTRISNTNDYANASVFTENNVSFTGGEYNLGFTAGTGMATCSVKVLKCVLTPYKASGATVGITSQSTLIDAIANAKDGEVIKLSDNISLTSPINIPADKNIILDLNGFSITNANGGAIRNNGTLKIINSSDTPGSVNGSSTGIINYGHLEIAGDSATDIVITSTSFECISNLKDDVAPETKLIIDNATIKGPTAICDTAQGSENTIGENTILEATGGYILCGYWEGAQYGAPAGSYTVSPGVQMKNTVNGKWIRTNGGEASTAPDASNCVAVSNWNELVISASQSQGGYTASVISKQSVSEGIELDNGYLTFVDIPNKNNIVRYDLHFYACPADSFQWTPSTQTPMEGSYNILFAKANWAGVSHTSSGTTLIQPAVGTSGIGTSSSNMVFSAKLDLENLQPWAGSTANFDKLGGETPYLWVRLNPCNSYGSDYDDQLWVCLGEFESWNSAANITNTTEKITLQNSVVTFTDIPAKNNIVRYDMHFYASPYGTYDWTSTTSSPMTGSHNIMFAKANWAGVSHTSTGATLVTPALDDESIGTNSSEITFSAEFNLKTLQPWSGSTANLDKLGGETPYLWVCLNPCNAVSSDFDDLTWKCLGYFESWNEAGGISDSDEAAANNFIANHLTLEDESIITSANQDNFQKILDGLSDWEALSDDAKAAVNAKLTAANGNVEVTYTQLLEDIDSRIHTITFDAKGGEVDPAFADTNMDSKLDTLPTPTRTGRYSFSGWFTAPSGGTKITTSTVFTEDTTVYARWLHITSPGSSTPVANYYKLTFNENGGSDISAITKASGTTIKLSGYIPVREGYEFDGWYSDYSLNNKITSVKLTKNTTVYAGWIEIAESFKDVNSSDWYYDDVMYVYEKGLMDGTGNNMFSPSLSTTRGMIVTVLYRLEGEPTVSDNQVFDDVALGEWYTKAVAWAASNGIVKGYGDGNYGPYDLVTREQLAAIMWRYAKYKGVDVSSGDKADISGFADDETISTYAVPAMKWAVSEGIITGCNGLLSPTDSATRAQVAAIFHRYCIMAEK